MILHICALIVVAAPAALALNTGISLLLGYRLSERKLALLTQATVSLAAIAATTLLINMLLTNQVQYTLELGRWVDLPHVHFHFTFKFLFDRLSIPFVILSLLLCGVISAFANRYLHRDEGYTRFFLFFVIFLLGMVVTSVAGTIETMFLGWELVGLSSALLVAFFHNRVNPVANGLRVWTIYRFADGAFLLAALVLHHLTGGGDLSLMMGSKPWPENACVIDSNQALLVGLLLLVAAAGKSALVPFSGWLPRAMEGPTPSSAIFYGALSVHLGAYLLLRVGPMLEQSPPLQWTIITIGGVTAVYAGLVGRVQTDVKSALAFASLLQVSIIVIEIGFGLRYLALVHILGHASMRSLQLLRAPSLLRDYRRLEDNIGYSERLNQPARPQLKPTSFRIWRYRFAMERGYLDMILDEWIARPFLNTFRWFDRLERRLVTALSFSRRTKTAKHTSEADEMEPS
jgi:NADH:ubiquinone oxidoreductase subunit 5 (subunit L)/multisubunit Na+/H+ antiporter MnhA subunit